MSVVWPPDCFYFVPILQDTVGFRGGMDALEKGKMSHFNLEPFVIHPLI
jgi:hypothetical protein